MARDNPKYESHFYGSVQGVVIGDHNTATFLFQSGEPLTVPFLAPPRPPYFLIGRDNLLRDLKEHLFTNDSLALSALNGLPGVGKTALAIELAHDRDVLKHFHDGLLWASAGRRPDVLAILSMWGTALGISFDEIARLTSVESLVQAIHVRIANRRMLLIVDDAWRIEEALAFKVGGPNCAYLLTTRLSEVALRFAGERVRVVQELSEVEGLELLARLAPGIVEAEPDSARTLVQAIGGLPLALALIGNYLCVQAYSGQARRVQAAFNRLKQVEERLRLEQQQGPLERHPSLPAGTPLSLLASISISEQALSEAARHTLWALSVFPPKPNSFSETAALAVSNMPVGTIDMLIDYRLLESSGRERYTLHQTISDYARVKHTDEAASERLAAFFVDYAEDHKTNLSVLDSEMSNIIAALDSAFNKGMKNILVRGVSAFYHLLEFRGLYALAYLHLKRLQEAAKSLGDMFSEGLALLHLGKVEEKRGNLEQAKMYYQESLVLARKVNHLELISDVLKGLGWVTGMGGNYEQAEAYFLEGLALVREIENLEHISALLQGLAWVVQMGGNYEQAEAYFLEGLALAREIGGPDQIGELLKTLGWMTGMHGNFEQAEAYFLEGLALARKVESRDHSIQTLQGLAWTKAMQGSYREAERLFLECLVLAREVEHHEQMTLLANLGWVTRSRGDYEQAGTYYQEGLVLARKAGHREKISLILTNLAELEHGRKNYRQAEVYSREGLALAREIGHQERIIDSLRIICMVAYEREDYAQAELYQQDGLALAQESQNQWSVGVFLNEGGKIYLRQNKLSAASTALVEALKRARETGSKELSAIVLYNLGRVAASQGNITEAHRQGQESLAIFEAIGTNQMTEVREWLAALPTVDPGE